MSRCNSVLFAYLQLLPQLAAKQEKCSEASTNVQEDRVLVGQREEGQCLNETELLSSKPFCPLKKYASQLSMHQVNTNHRN